MFGLSVLTCFNSFFFKSIYEWIILVLWHIKFILYSAFAMAQKKFMIAQDQLNSVSFSSMRHIVKCIVYIM